MEPAAGHQKLARHRSLDHQISIVSVVAEDAFFDVHSAASSVQDSLSGAYDVLVEIGELDGMNHRPYRVNRRALCTFSNRHPPAAELRPVSSG